MMIFSILTLINIRKSSNALCRRYGNNYGRVSCVQNSRGNRFTRHRIEQQLTSMIITETIGTILTTLPYAIYVMYRAVRVENDRNLETLARENSIERLVRLTMYFEPSCGFYVYLFTLTTLRKRFIRVLLSKIRFF
jgi:hypothetical protein